MPSRSQRRTSNQAGIGAVAQVPSWIYQRYDQLWQHVGLAAGWALFFVLVDAGVSAYGGIEGMRLPVQWRVVLAALILISGMWKPVAAYAAFVAAVAYPLYQISVYVMALALAVLILSAPLAARYLPLALMIAGAPLLAPYHLTPVLPLLFGLWASEEPLGQWGRGGGALAGGLCALWLKFGAGMAGSSIDLWVVNGWRMDVGPIYERFHTANSLETLIRLIEPFTVQGDDAATAVLLHVLQVFLWAGAAYAVGAVHDLLLLRKLGRAGQGSASTALLSLVPGLVLIWAGYVAVPSWLRVPGPRWAEPLWLPAQVVLAGGVALGLDGLLRYLRRPMIPRSHPAPALEPRPARRSLRRRAQKAETSQEAQVLASSAERQTGRGRTSGPQPSPGKGPKEKGQAGQEDIIMIELD